jgi:hypothetical protein
MGNRAVIAINEYNDDAIGIYLHWNGGRDSIEAFLLAAKEIMQDRLGDETYGAARLVQCITTFFTGNLSVGLAKCKNLDCENFDNGVYVVDTRTMEIIDRHHHSGEEQGVHNIQQMAAGIVADIKAGNNDSN